MTIGLVGGYAFLLKADWVAVVIEPTCTEKSFTTYTCSRCGASYRANETDALGHNKFHPNGTMPRAMMVTVLYHMVGSPAVDDPATFSDVPTAQWYSDAISWTQSNGIVGGVGHNLFAPETPVTREALATILWRSQGFPATSTDLSGTITATLTAQCSGRLP